MGIRTSKTTLKIHFLFGFLLLASVVISSIYVTGNKGYIMFERINEYKAGQIEEINVFKEEINDGKSCNLSSGRWVYDNITMPLYKEGQCSFMLDEFTCEKYGRKNLKYQEWRWQPHDCDFPRFNATAMLEKIRGKKLLYVGDSLNRNQYYSLLCLIESSLPSSSDKTVIQNGNLFLFQSTEYNTSIGFYWSPFLIESNNDNPGNHRLQNRIIRIKSIENHAKHWTDADILIFDSFMWWLSPTTTILWGSFGSNDTIYKTTVDKMYRLYEMGLNTWSDWLEFNIDPTKTKLFFMSLSPYHASGDNWGGKQNCYNETELIFKEKYWGRSTDRKIMRIAESVIHKLDSRGLKVQYLDITRMSDYRKDAHPTIYRTFYRSISEQELKDPSSYSDCVHWCLPGVPDTWNEILYSHIMNS